MKRGLFVAMSSAAIVLMLCLFYKGMQNETLPKEVSVQEVDNTLSGQNLKERREVKFQPETEQEKVIGLTADYAAVLLETMRNNDMEKLQAMIAYDELPNYGYRADQNSFVTYFEGMSEMIPENASIQIYSVRESSLNPTAWISNCYIVSKDLSGVDRNAYLHEDAIWFTMTLFFNEAGEIVGMLPCVDDSLNDYQEILGLIK